VEPTTKVINASHTVWNFSLECRGMLFWWLGGNPTSGQ